MKLSEFIRKNHEQIVHEWAAFAATLKPAADGLTTFGLRDHADKILGAIVLDLEQPQGEAEQLEKSKGHGTERRLQAVGSVHAAHRIEDGFKLSQLVAEYRALRATVLRLFEKSKNSAPGRVASLHQVTRFNEALDEALVEATDRYMLVMNQTRDQFLAVLGHDLRNPLGAIIMSAALMTARGLEEKNAKAATQIAQSGERMRRMLNDLLDLTRTRLGSGIPIAPKPMDLGALCKEVLSEIHAFHPDRQLNLRTEGDLQGSWDADRLAQVLSNLAGNALQHGERDSPIRVVARADGKEVVVDVHNEGRAIPLDLLTKIFEPMIRNAVPGESGATTSLGLGLYIARQAVLAHCGTVTVKSTKLTGTTFTVRLPRHSVCAPVFPEVDEPQDRRNARGEIVATGAEAEDRPSVH